MSPMWRYFYATFACFYLAPGIRRVQDLYLGYSGFEIWSILPLLMLIPFFYVVAMHGRYKRIPSFFMRASWLWISGFIYAFFLAFLQNNLAAGALTFAQFVLPLGAGLWLVTEELPASIVFDRMLKFLFIITTIVSVYAVIQWVVVPPWDAEWLKNIRSTSFGNPVPFQMRAFSTLNGPGVFGQLVAAVMLLALPHIDVKNPKFMVGFLIWFIGMGVTSVRTSWVMFALGAVVYFLLTRRIQQMLSIIAATAALVMLISVIDPANPVIGSVGDRVSSFSDIQGDESFNQRSSLYGEMVPQILRGPIGMGLGVFGAGGRMNEGGLQIDSGILSRVLEMGWVGCGLLIASLYMSLSWCVRNLIAQPKFAGPTFDRFASLLALQLSLLFLEVSGEAHLGILGLLYWTTFAAAALPTRSPLPTTYFREHPGRRTVSGTM